MASPPNPPEVLPNVPVIHHGVQETDNLPNVVDHSVVTDGSMVQVVLSKQGTVRGFGFRFPCPFGVDPTKGMEYGPDHSKVFSYNRSRSLRVHLKKDHIHVNICPVVTCTEKMQSVDEFIDHYFHHHLGQGGTGDGNDGNDDDDDEEDDEDDDEDGLNQHVQDMHHVQQDVEEDDDEEEEEDEYPPRPPSPRTQSLKNQLDQIFAPKLHDLWTASHTMLLNILTKAKEVNHQLESIITHQKPHLTRRGVGQSGLEFPIPADPSSLKQNTGAFPVSNDAIDDQETQEQRSINQKIVKSLGKRLKHEFQKSFVDYWVSYEPAVAVANVRNIAKDAVQRVYQTHEQDVKNFMLRMQHQMQSRFAIQFSEDVVTNAIFGMLVNFRRSSKKRFEGMLSLKRKRDEEEEDEDEDDEDEQKMMDKRRKDEQQEQQQQQEQQEQQQPQPPLDVMHLPDHQHIPEQQHYESFHVMHQSPPPHEHLQK